MTPAPMPPGRTRASPMEKSMRLAAPAALALLALLLPAAAAAQETPSACVADERDFDALLASLEAEGWEAVATGAAIPGEVVERVALGRTVFYATSDRGGETPAAVMDLQRRTVPGLARRVDTDLAKSRVLTRGDAAMTLNWGMPQEGRLDIVEVICRVSTPGGTRATGTEEGFGPTAIRTIPDPLRRVITVALEPALLRDLTTDASTVTIVETVSVLPPEESR